MLLGPSFMSSVIDTLIGDGKDGVASSIVLSRTLRSSEGTGEVALKAEVQR